MKLTLLMAISMVVCCVPALAGRSVSMVPFELNAAQFVPGPNGSFSEVDVIVKNVSDRRQTVTVSIEEERRSDAIKRTAGSPGPAWVESVSHPDWYQLSSGGLTYARAQRTVTVLLGSKSESSPASVRKITFAMACGWRPSGVTCTPNPNFVTPPTTVTQIDAAQSHYYVRAIRVSVTEDSGAILATAHGTVLLAGNLTSAASDERTNVLFNGGRPF